MVVASLLIAKSYAVPMWSLSRTLLATVTLLLVACASTGPQRTDDGLERVPSRVVDAVYVRPAADLPRYDRLLLEPVVVQFDRHWDPRDFGLWGLQADEVARLRMELASLALSTFTRRLNAAGFRVVGTEGAGVLRLNVRLVDVYVNAPEPLEPSRHVLVFEFGRMTMHGEVSDAVTGQVVLRLSDAMQQRKKEQLEWAAGVFNRAESEREFVRWADALADALGATGVRRTGP